MSPRRGFGMKGLWRLAYVVPIVIGFLLVLWGADLVGDSVRFANIAIKYEDLSKGIMLIAFGAILTISWVSLLVGAIVLARINEMKRA